MPSSFIYKVLLFLKGVTYLTIPVYYLLSYNTYYITKLQEI